MAIRLKDIAETCGVDVSTVSRALSGDARVKDATRKRIVSVACDMGYRPNPAARSLVGARTRTIWMLVSSLDDPLQREFAESASTLLVGQGYDLSVMLYQGDEARYRYLLSRLNGQLTDGALVFPSYRRNEGEAEWDVLFKNAFPLVFIDRHPEGARQPTVTTDNAAATVELVQCLQRRGASRFVVLMQTGGNLVEESRCLAALDTLGRDGVPFVRTNAFDAGFLKSGSGVGIIGTGQSTVQAFVQEHQATLAGTALSFGVFDRWDGDPYPATSVCVCEQDFPAMANRACLQLLQMIEDEPMAVGVTQVRARAFRWVESSVMRGAETP